MLKLTILFLFLTSSALADVLPLSSLHWPPYTSRSLPDGGKVVDRVREALQSQGHDLSVDFLPWSRAILYSKQQRDGKLGFFPAYKWPRSGFIISDKVGMSRIGLVQNIMAPIQFKELTKSNGLRIGTVQDYKNPSFIEQLSELGKIELEEVTSDRTNLKKVGYKRIDAAVIDVDVMTHILNTDKRVRRYKRILAIHPDSIVEVSLHVAFIDNEKGRRWRNILNRGLKATNKQ